MVISIDLIHHIYNTYTKLQFIFSICHGFFIFIFVVLLHTCMHVCKHIYIYIYMYVYMYVYVCACICMYMCIYMCICIYICMCTCVQYLYVLLPHYISTLYLHLYTFVLFSGILLLYRI